MTGRCSSGWVLGLLLGLGLQGCAPAVVVGGAVTTKAVAERRGGADFVDDQWVAMKLRTAYAESEVVKFGNVNVQIYRGVVVLTGTAESQAEIDEAVRIANATRGVVKVHSELKVQHVSAGEYAADSWITTQVKSKLLASKMVRGLDIQVETTKKVVYLIGLAQSVAERDEAVRLAMTVGGVREVVSYVDVDPNTAPVTRTESQPPPAMGAGVGSDVHGD